MKNKDLDISMRTLNRRLCPFSINPTSIHSLTFRQHVAPSSRVPEDLVDHLSLSSPAARTPDVVVPELHLLAITANISLGVTVCARMAELMCSSTDRDRTHTHTLAEWITVGQTDKRAIMQYFSS